MDAICGKEGSIEISPKNAAGNPKFIWNTGREQDTSNKVDFLGKGNYTVTIVDSNDCQADTTLKIDFYPLPTVVITKMPETCHRENGSITLSATSANPNTINYQWIGLSGISNEAINLKSGIYKVIITDSLCKIDTTIIIGHVNGVVANFTATSYSVPINVPFTLTDASKGSPHSWFWDMGDGENQTGKIVHYSYDQAGNYLVFMEVTDTNECMDTISKIISVYNEMHVYIPNTFTPNGDKLNDTWKPILLDNAKEDYVLTVYDRWGQCVFHTADPDASWDGTINGKLAQSNPVYSYHLVVKDSTGKQFEYTGYVAVVM